MESTRKCIVGDKSKVIASYPHMENDFCIQTDDFVQTPLFVNRQSTSTSSRLQVIKSVFSFSPSPWRQPSLYTGHSCRVLVCEKVVTAVRYLLDVLLKEVENEQPRCQVLSCEVFYLCVQLPSSPNDQTLIVRD